MTASHPRPRPPLLVSASAALLASVLLLSTGPALAAAPSWVSPLAGPVAVLAPFDPPAKPWLAGHRGVDLSASSIHALVRAAGPGVVSFAAVIAGKPTMTISHGTLRTTYEPVEPLVPVGETVSEGQVIGTLSLGSHCPNPCLHWGLIRGQDYLDPLALLVHRPPVLKSLPLVTSGTKGAPPIAPRSGPGLATVSDVTGRQLNRSDASSTAEQLSQVHSSVGLAIAGGLGALAAAAEGLRRRRRARS